MEKAPTRKKIKNQISKLKFSGGNSHVCVLWGFRLSLAPSLTWLPYRMYLISSSNTANVIKPLNSRCLLQSPCDQKGKSKPRKGEKKVQSKSSLVWKGVVSNAHGVEKSTYKMRSVYSPVSKDDLIWCGYGIKSEPN